MEELRKRAEKRNQKCMITRLNSSIRSILKLSDTDGNIYIHCMHGNVPCFPLFSLGGREAYQM